MTEAPPGIASARIPTSVTVAGVGSLVFASLGVMGAGMGLLTVLMQRNAMEGSRAMGAGDPDVGRVMDSMVALQEQIFLPTLAGQVFAGLAAVLFGTAGVVVLMRHRLTPVVAPALLGGMALFAVLDAAMSGWIQVITFEAMGSMVGSMGEPGPAAPMMDTWFGAMLAFSFACLGGWLLVKLTFAVWAALHLRSPAIVGLFGGPTILSGRGD